MKKYKQILLKYLSFFSLATNFSFFVSCNHQQQEQKAIVNFVENSNKDQYLKISLYENKSAFYISEIGLKRLTKRIQDNLFFGPEIMFLKQININKQIKLFQDDRKLTGFFSSNTQEIFINSEFYENIDNEDDRIELLYQLIFHEYIHFLDSVYFSNYGNNFKVKGKIYNDFFIDNINKLLKTDTKMDYEKVSDIINENHLFNKLTLKEILDKVNKEKNKLDFNFENTSFFPKNTDPSIVIEDVNYYYNYEEFIAREAFKYFYKEKENNLSLNSDTFLREWLRVADVKKKDKKVVIEKIYAPYVLFDNNDLSNNENVKKFANIFLKAMNYGKNISGIFIDDQTKLNNLNQVINSRNFNLVKFIGYLDNQKVNALVFKNKKESNLIKIPIIYNTFDQFKFFNDQKYYSYYSSEFLDIELIDKNYLPKLWTDYNNNGKIEENELKEINNFSDKFNDNYYPSSFRSFFKNLDNYNFINFKDKKINQKE
ncbi:hypothetical protein [Mesomycoplasma lagogenitalium]|uniref:Lipoprotein n=1 Tax=Mesomycoplasma lagogenitalium TaxID=171286 RepID=A0ABY8LV36_9BACT|nr:hypothetical protein [Mesomycoplasma lagogenitalium]WGI36615.1 hypothetical protein QEG99_04085 [Mesomycoplasma lagogenitalium]